MLHPWVDVNVSSQNFPFLWTSFRKWASWCANPVASSTHLCATSCACETCHNFNTTQVPALDVQKVNLCFHLSIFQVAYVTTCSILQSIRIHCFIISLLYVMCETALWNGDMWRYLNRHHGTLDVTRSCCKWIRSCARVNCGHDERLRQTAMKSHVVLSFQ